MVRRAACLLTLLAAGAAAQDAPERRDLRGDPLPEHAVARLGTARLRHRGAVTGLAFAAGGARLFSIGDEPFVRVWDADTGRETARLGSRRPTALAVSRDEDALAVALEGGIVNLWTLDRATGEVSGGGGFGGFTRGEEPAARRITSLCFGAEPSILAVGRADGGVRMAVDGKPGRRLSRHTAAVTSLAFSGSGDQLATGSEDRTVRLWDPHDGKHLVSMVGHAHGVAGIGFDAQGEHVAAVGQDGTFRVFGRTNGVDAWPDPARSEGGRADAGVVSPDGAFAALGHRDGSITVWRIATREQVLRLAAHSGPVTALAFRRDGLVLASGSADRTVRVWDVPSGDAWVDLGRGGPGSPASEDAPPTPDRVEALVFAPDSTTLVTVAWDRTMRLWDATTGERVRRLPGPARAGRARLVQVGLTARGDAVELWRDGDLCALREVTTGEQTVRLRLERADTALALGRGLSRLFVGTRGGSIRELTLPDGELVRDHGSVAGAAIVRLAVGHGHVAALDEQGGAHVLDLQTREVVSSALSDVSPTALALSPDGRRLAVATNARTVLLLSPGGEPRTLPGHEDAVRCLAFSPDARYLASGADDATVLVWPVP